MTKNRAIIQTIGLVAAASLSGGLFLLNRAIYLIGLSAVAGDANATLKLVLELVDFVPWWAWLTGFVVATGVLLFNNWKVFSSLNEYLSQSNELRAEIASLRMTIENGFESHIANTAKAIDEKFREFETKFSGELQYVSQQNLIFSRFLALKDQMASVEALAAGCRLRDDAEEPEDGWDEWSARKAQFEIEHADVRNDLRKIASMIEVPNDWPYVINGALDGYEAKHGDMGGEVFAFDRKDTEFQHCCRLVEQAIESIAPGQFTDETGAPYGKS